MSDPYLKQKLEWSMEKNVWTWTAVSKIWEMTRESFDQVGTQTHRLEQKDWHSEEAQIISKTIRDERDVPVRTWELKHLGVCLTQWLNSRRQVSEMLEKNKNASMEIFLEVENNEH